MPFSKFTGKVLCDVNKIRRCAMPGFEIFGDEERKEVQDVLDTGVLFRYGRERDAGKQKLLRQNCQN